jgi:hypothetical protein
MLFSVTPRRRASTGRTRLASLSSKAEALDATLIGALVGGLLQSTTFVTGIMALLLIVTALYFLAFATRLTRGESTAERLASAAG